MVVSSILSGNAGCGGGLLEMVAMGGKEIEEGDGQKRRSVARVRPYIDWGCLSFLN